LIQLQEITAAQAQPRNVAHVRHLPVNWAARLSAPSQRDGRLRMIGAKIFLSNISLSQFLRSRKKREEEK
jgi:hypothetical protein